MTSGQSVGILGRIGVWRVIALVCGHQTQAMIYFQRVRIIDNLDTFAYILFRYAVMVKPEGDIARYALLLRSVALSSDGVWREAGGGSRTQSARTVPVWTGDARSSCVR